MNSSHFMELFNTRLQMKPNQEFMKYHENDVIRLQYWSDERKINKKITGSLINEFKKDQEEESVIAKHWSETGYSTIIYFLLIFVLILTS